jgi:hypothetical protein
MFLVVSFCLFNSHVKSMRAFCSSDANGCWFFVQFWISECNPLGSRQSGDTTQRCLYFPCSVPIFRGIIQTVTTDHSGAVLWTTNEPIWRYSGM